MPRAPRIAVIGGGIGGLAAALALERRGAEVIVAEQSAVHSEIGAGLNLTPNAVKAFRALGLEQEVEDIGWGSEFGVIRSWKSGRYITRIRRGDFRQKYGAPNLTVHRADLLDVLRGALRLQTEGMAAQVQKFFPRRIAGMVELGGVAGLLDVDA